MNGLLQGILCQITSIADHIDGPASADLDLGEMRELSLAFSRAASRVEQQISNRVALCAYPEPPSYLDIVSINGEDAQ